MDDKSRAQIVQVIQQLRYIRTQLSSQYDADEVAKVTHNLEQLTRKK